MWGGYDIEWQLLNSKLHGVPQNRERVYTIGHLRARGCRKVFPISAASGKDCIQGISLIGTRKGYHRNLQTFSPYGVTETLFTCDGGGREHHVALPLFGIDFNVGGQERPIANTIKARYDAGVTNFKQDGTAVAVPVTFANGQVLGKIDVAHCLSAYGPAKEGVNTHQAMNRVCVPIKDAVAKGYSDAYVGDSINLTAINSKTRRGRVGGGVAQTLDTQCAQATLEVIEGPVPSNQSDHPGVMVELAPDCHVYAVWYEKYQCYVAIRKLTPKECFRLQGWTDDYFEKAQFVNSDSQLYKQAGNGVTVNVVYEIAKKMEDKHESD